jgi:hypothetical protein
MLTCVCSCYDDGEAKFHIEKWKGKEDAYIDSVRLCGTLSSQDPPKACIVFRIPVRILFDYHSCIYFLIVLVLLFKDFHVGDVTFFSVIHQWEINLQVGLVRKESAVTFGQNRTCHLQKLV